MQSVPIVPTAENSVMMLSSGSAVSLDKQSSRIARLQSKVRELELRLDWAASISCWDHLIELQPRDPAFYVGKAAAHRALDQRSQADAVVFDFLKHEPITPELAVSLALNAQVGSDWENALDRWDQVRRKFPAIPTGWASTAAMLQVLDRTEEAEVLLAEARGLFPESIDVAAQHVAVATLRQDWPEAWLRWESLQHLHSGHIYVTGDGLIMRNTIFNALKGLNPTTIQTQALESDAKHDWTRSIGLWGILYNTGSTDSMVMLGYGRALRQAGRHDEADDILLGASRAYPEHAEIRANYAEVSVSRKDWKEAEKRWADVLRDHPGVPALWLMAALACMEAGSFERAEKLLGDAVKEEPERVDLWVYYAKLAERQGNWQTAVKRWDAALKLEPEEQNIRNSRGEAIWEESAKRLERGEKSQTSATQENSVSGEDDISLLKQLAMRFEGLGDNCEFGIVQRRFGAEPIGLFRFAAIGVKALVTLAEESFSSLGDPKYLKLSLTKGDEYLVTDTRGLYHMHSFVRKGTVDEAKFLRQQITRLGYLKKKLIEDLSDAEKVFVYKASEERLSDNSLQLLRKALSRYGNIVLLGIRKVEPGHERGSLQVLDSHTLVGYAETLYDGDESPIDLVAWRSILQQADHYRATLNHRSP